MSKPTKQRVHGRAFGYEPGRMKPVHFATGYFLAVTGRWYRLERLNKGAVTSHKDGLKEDYLPERQLATLRSDERLASRIDLTKLEALRQQVNAVVGNDAAVFAAFPPYSQFGNDYTLTSARFVTNHKRLDGFSGYFVARALDRCENGRAVLKFSERWISQGADPIERCLAPLLDTADEENDWTHDYEGKFGSLDDARLDEVSTAMEVQTAAVARLCQNIDASTPHHSRLRALVLALSCWLVAYLLRASAQALGQGRPLIFMDFLGQTGTRCRVQSCASFARHREMLYRSYGMWNSANRFAGLQEDYSCFASRDKKTGEAREPDFKFLEQHFSDLTVRIGIAQPRAAQAFQSRKLTEEIAHVHGRQRLH